MCFSASVDVGGLVVDKRCDELDEHYAEVLEVECNQVCVEIIVGYNECALLVKGQEGGGDST